LIWKALVMKFIVTIDVEEDNWGDYNPDKVTVENIKRIPALQTLFEEFDVRPTYLIDYPVAVDPYAIELFSGYLDRGVCEIGMHCPPWNTPPVIEELCERNTMLCNLPEDLVFHKLSTLHATIYENFGVAPVSFRAGRWGFGPVVAKALARLDIRIDSSVTPYMDWDRYCGPNFSGSDPGLQVIHSAYAVREEIDSVLQVPVTIGFLQENFARCSALMHKLEAPLARKLHVPGLLKRCRLLNKVWLSPENFNVKEMLLLVRSMEKNKYPILNMFFHSVSLQAGLSPFVRTWQDEDDFFQRMRGVLEYVREKKYTRCTLAELENGDGDSVLLHQVETENLRSILKGWNHEEADTYLVD
jgi:hypothetical protein